MSSAAQPANERIRRVVCGVVAQAIEDAGAAGVIVLEDWTPEGELVYEWLVSASGEARVWRGAAMAANVQEGGATLSGLPRDRGPVLIAHPANRTALLLGARIPLADVLPLGDLYATEVQALTGAWSAPHDVEPLIERVGLAAVDQALRALVDERREPAEALHALPDDEGRTLLAWYERGRYWRRRPRLVPKLTARTLSIDLFD